MFEFATPEPKRVSAPWRGTLPVVGVGLAGRAGMSPRGRLLLDRAEVVVGSPRQLEQVGTAAHQRRVLWHGKLPELIGQLDGLAADRSVLLASGDPNMYGIGASLVARFGSATVDMEPAVSSLQLALARAGLPFVSTALLSVVGRPLNALGPARFARRAAILTDEQNDPAAAARFLIDLGLEPEAQAFIAERLGAEDERIRVGELGSLPSAPYDPLTVLVVQRQAACGPSSGQDESLYAHRRGQVTKAEVRAVALAGLDISPEDVVWDVGAGCGSVTVEAARLAAAGSVYAVERERTQIELLQQNLASQGSWNVAVSEGDALAVMPSLPVPDAVFVGGGGRDLAPILQLGITALRRRRAAVPGRVVATFATLEAVSDAYHVCLAEGLRLRISQVQVARAREVGGRLALAALNPVFVLVAQVSRG